ncbi:hypothetical protein FKP32DRAFT_1675202 [Trametes sanguinea]|nr:hypothetical protein FKP32DRAFT_1675202 [Trametes sanguinea]
MDRSFVSSTPPFRYDSTIVYQPVHVVCLRPCITFYGPRFAITTRPLTPLSFGSRIHLNLRYLEKHSSGIVNVMLDTQICGTIFAIASLSPNFVEFLMTNDGVGHPFAYLVVPLYAMGYLGRMPAAFWAGYRALEPLLYSTYWQENNVRPLQRPLFPHETFDANVESRESPFRFRPPSSTRPTGCVVPAHSDGEDVPPGESEATEVH